MRASWRAPRTSKGKMAASWRSVEVMETIWYCSFVVKLRERTWALLRKHTNVREDEFPNIRRSVSGSFGEHLEKSAHGTWEEVTFYYGMACKLARKVGFGWKWLQKLLQLMLYAFLMLPGFLYMVGYYFTSKRVERNIMYRKMARNRLDLYLPRIRREEGKSPVVIFVTGGAWVIGYKGWGAGIGKLLSNQGFIVACLDYRNYPQGCVPDMLEDVMEGINWTFRNAACYGGDPNKIYLVGQSAGAHLTSLALIKQGERIKKGVDVDWKPHHLQGYVGVSGPYNITQIVEHFNQRGLYSTLFLHLMTGIDRKNGYANVALEGVSPECLVRAGALDGVKLPPYFCLMHGTADITVPSSQAVSFAETLMERKVDTKLIKLQLIEGKTHTDFMINDPMRGDPDEVIEEVVEMAYGKEARKLVVAPAGLLPRWLVALASAVCPF